MPERARKRSRRSGGCYWPASPPPKHAGYHDGRKSLTDILEGSTPELLERIVACFPVRGAILKVEVSMKIKYTRDADVLVIQLREGKPADSRDIAEGIIVHLTAKGQPLEIEILDASKVVQKKDVEIALDALFP
jgi:uncharacterized protein YuzE